MSIATVITAGFGNGTFTGSIKDVVTRGYSIASYTEVNMRSTIVSVSELPRISINNPMPICSIGALPHIKLTGD